MSLNQHSSYTLKQNTGSETVFINFIKKDTTTYFILRNGHVNGLKAS